MRWTHLRLLPTALCLGTALLLSMTTLACAGAPDDAEDAEGSEEDALSKCGKEPTWKLQMRDDFDVWDEKSDKRWTKEDGRVVPNSKTCHLASNVTVSGGALRIATRNEPACGQPYSGGALDSYGKVWTGKYFKAEIRAKVSQDHGIFGAPLWFRPGNSSGATGVGGEIDLVESLGKWDNKPRFQTTLHADYSSEATPVFEHFAYRDLGDADGTHFHTYVVEKVKGGITFYTDGKRVAGWGCGNAANVARPKWYARWLEENPDGWSMRIDNKVGGGWADDPDGTTKWGRDTTLVIDYIKLWRPG